MIPSRGLQPIRRAQFASGASICLRAGAPRQFSSIRRNATNLSTVRRQLSPRQFNASSVRYASWYAPWTWGVSKTPATDADPTAPADFAKVHQTPAIEPATAATAPDVAPAAADQAVAVEEAAATATHSAQRTVEDIVENAFNTDLSDVVHKGAGLIEKHGALKELGLDYGWGPTAFFEWMIEHIYLDTGIGWGASIIAVTLLIRVALFKFQMNGSDSMAKMQAVAPVVKDLSDKMAEAIKNGDDETNREARKRQMQIYKAIGVKPINTIAPMLMQGVIGFGAFRCLRGMSTLPVPGMDQSGWLWFTDLTVTDPYHLLPFLSGGIMCLAMKLGGETGAGNDTLKPGMKTAMQYGFPAIMAFISFWQPASIQIYLTCTSILSSTTATLLRNQKFRKATGLTLLPTKHAQELWTKVARNEIPLERVFKDGKLVPIELKPAYQPPSNPHASQIRGLNVKAGAAVPMHLRPGAVAADTQFQDRDHDYDDPPTGILNKIDWFGRNYKPKFLYMRLKLWMSRVSGREDVRRELLQRKKDIARKKAEEYEFRRRQRFTGRQ